MIDLDFSFHLRKKGEVEITRHNKSVQILRGQRAQEFAEEIGDLSPDEQQQLMARLTGNYKRGNEKQAKLHNRNR
jgi:hypothetical protein